MRGSAVKKLKNENDRIRTGTAWKIRKASLTLAFMVTALLSVNAETYTVTASPPPTMIYSDIQTVQSTGTITTGRSSTGNRLNYYYLITGAASGGDFLVGSRKLYLNGNKDSSWLQVYLRPTTGTSEIGTTNIPGTTFLSGTIKKDEKEGPVDFIAVVDPAATGASVPDGVYQNTFYFSLYIRPRLMAMGTPTGVSVPIVVKAEVSLAKVKVTITPEFCNFGSMVVGGNYSVSTNLTVESNRSFWITAASQHAGKLYLSDTDQIPYTFSFAGTTYSLDLGSVTLVTNAPPGLASYYVKFGIQNLDFLEPGTYSDSVTFTVTTY